jgi:hypothetical protein
MVGYVLPGSWYQISSSFSKDSLFLYVSPFRNCHVSIWGRLWITISMIFAAAIYEGRYTENSLLWENYRALDRWSDLEARSVPEPFLWHTINHLEISGSLQVLASGYPINRSNPSWQMPGRGRYNRSELFCDWPNLKSAEMRSPLRPEPVVGFQCTGVSGSKMELFVQFAINSSYHVSHSIFLILTSTLPTKAVKLQMVWARSDHSIRDKIHSNTIWYLCSLVPYNCQVRRPTTPAVLCVTVELSIPAVSVYGKGFSTDAMKLQLRHGGNARAFQISCTTSQPGVWETTRVQYSLY